MIVQTRYRDIPWEEVQRLHHMMPHGGKGPEDWERNRGRQISIATPARQAVIECGAAHFDVVGEPVPRWACSHIAEIGD